MKTLAERFWTKVKKSNHCWEWQGGKDGDGYGLLWSGDYQQRLIKAHRVSYLIHYGMIPKGLFILHKCDNPSCTNPKHLFTGTLKDNSQDMLAKGRFGGAKCRIPKETVMKIRELFLEGVKQIHIAKQLNLNPQYINKVVHNERRVLLRSGE